MGKPLIYKPRGQTQGEAELKQATAEPMHKPTSHVLYKGSAEKNQHPEVSYDTFLCKRRYSECFSEGFCGISR